MGYKKKSGKRIPSRGTKLRRHRASKTKRRLIIGALATAIMGGTISSPLASLIANGVGISEPNLRYIGGPPKTPSLEVKGIPPTGHALYVTLRPAFRNWSFKGGHVTKVTLAPDGLNDTPKKIEVISLDRSEIGWFEEKEIRCELLVIVDPAMITAQPAKFRFRIYFYGPKGNQLYWESIVVEGWRKAA